MLVATAGHVDHGKTALIRRLTGVDTDRLPEEKRRGLSIDLGFAYRALDSGKVLGFVDVPGHERFVRNMLAGVPAVDLALLVVAADDGPMPQTREHLAILGLLGVPRMIVAVTKIDRVSSDRVEAVRTTTAELIAASGIDAARMFPLSSLTGEGVPALENFLLGAVNTTPDRIVRGAFRLAIDRSFTLTGTGLVVTGAVFAGAVEVGDRLSLAPGGGSVRVRGIHAQNRESPRGRVGERLALNISGHLSQDDLHRGQWLVAADAGAVSDRFDALLRVLPTEQRPLAHWTPVHVHHGAASLTGRVATLGGRLIDPGQRGFVQIVLDGATQVVYGDRFVLRDQSAQRTIAGGTVIDPFAPRAGRNREQRVELLTRLLGTSPAAAFGELLEHARAGIATDTFARTYNLTAAETGALVAGTHSKSVDVDQRPVLLSAARHAAIRNEILTALGCWHRAHPEQMGPDLKALLGQLHDRESRQLRAAVVEELLRSGEIRRRGRALGLAHHRPALPAEDAALWNRVAPLLGSATAQPPVVHDLAERLELEPRVLEAFLKRAVARGQLVRVTPNRFLHHAAVAALAAIAQELCEQSPSGRFDAGSYKQAADIGRNFCIQLLEYFDVAKLTRRVGDERTVIGEAGKLFGNG
jgi:selenocysteine-specific elongation factor